MDAEALDRAGISFNSNFILGGQIAGQETEIYQIYPEGNAIHASSESPFLQIGELKYGKPILDRVFSRQTSLGEAVKLGLLSLDATAKSNLSVGTPFELFAYKVNSLEVRYRIKFEENDPYLRMVRERWQEGLIQLVRDIPELDASQGMNFLEPGRTGAVKICGITAEEDALMAIDAGSGRPWI